MEEKLNETNVEAARITVDGGFQLIKVILFCVLPHWNNVTAFSVRFLAGLSVIYYVHNREHLTCIDDNLC